jgi:hypothetical protein
MSGWGTFFLYVHILAVIVAFGPTFAFPLIGAMSGKHPQYAMILTEVMEKIEKRMTIPLAVVVALAGTGLIYAQHIDLWKTGWLVAGIILFAIAFFFALLVQGPTTVKLLNLLKSMPAPPPGGPPPGGGEGGPPPGPPPQVAALVKRVQMGGAFLTVMILVILFLMIWGREHAGVTTTSLLIPAGLGLRIRRPSA